MNYAVLKSDFGDYWIGKTKLPVREGSIFSTFDEAQETALALCDDDIKGVELDEETEGDVEEVSKNLEKWII